MSRARVSQSASAAVPRERPILFSANMVQALLAGRKSATRRLTRPPHQAGDLLWVRESFTADWQPNRIRYEAGSTSREVQPEEFAWASRYRQPEGTPRAYPRLVPAIHAPRWSSRLLLRVTKTPYGQPATQMTEADFRAEGWPGPDWPIADSPLSPQDWFALLWDHLHGSGRWASLVAHPATLLWVIEFDVVEVRS